MTRWQNVPVPSQIAILPREQRGFPVSFVAQKYASVIVPPPIDKRFMEVAVPDRNGPEEITLGIMDEENQRTCFLKQICQVCGIKIRGQLWTAGGVDNHPLDEFLFREPFTDLSCMRYALQVCPGLVSGARRGDLRVVRVRKYTLYQERMAELGKPKLFPFEYKPPHLRHSVLFYFRCRVDDGDVLTVPEFLEKTA